MLFVRECDSDSGDSQRESCLFDRRVHVYRPAVRSRDLKTRSKNKSVLTQSRAGLAGDETLC
jgi:hypothetical protein